MRRSLARFLQLIVIALLTASISFCTRPETPDPKEDQTEQPSGPDTPENPDGPDNPDNPDDPDAPGDPPAPEVIHVSELNIGPDEDVVLEIGQTKQLSCTVLPDDAEDKSFRWKSDHPEIATVSDKGLVTAVAVGDATISAIATDGGITDTKLVTVYKPQAEAFTSIKFIDPSSTDSHLYRRLDNGDIVVRFNVGQSYQFKAQGTPEDAADELEYVYGSNALAFSITSDGQFKAVAGCGMKYGGQLVANALPDHFIVRSKKNPKVARKVYVQIEGMNAERAVISDISYPSSFLHPSISGEVILGLRYSEYIGTGHTREFAVRIERKDLSTGMFAYSGSVDFSIVSSSGPVSFVKDGKKFRATVITPTAVSTADNPVTAEVTIRVNGYERTIPFKVSSYDPLYPKIGDGLSTSYEFYLDGGYRGHGIFEKPPYDSNLLKANAMIAYVGDKPYNNDPIYKNYCKGGIPGMGSTVYHGIVIPTNTGRLYRSSQTSGEIFQKDYDILPNSDSWPTSWFTPSWITNKNDNAYAFANTCAMVYRNRFCGTSHDVKPANFFVSYWLLEASKNDREVKTNDFSWESDFYGDFESGNLKSSSDAFNVSPKYSYDKEYFRSDWLWPAANDIGYIFRDSGLSISSLNTVENSVNISDPQIAEKIKAFRTCGKFFSGTTPSYSYDYWISQSSPSNYTAPRVTIDSNGKITIKLVDKSSNRAYVLPIAYF